MSENEIRGVDEVLGYDEELLIKFRYQAVFFPSRERTVLCRWNETQRDDSMRTIYDTQKIWHPDFMLIWLDSESRLYWGIRYDAFVVVPMASLQSLQFMLAPNIIKGQVCLGHDMTDATIEEHGVGSVFWNTVFEMVKHKECYHFLTHEREYFFPPPVIKVIKLLGEKMGRDFL